MPVFFVRDGISFPDTVHALKPNPRNHIQGVYRSSHVCCVQLPWATTRCSAMSSNSCGIEVMMSHAVNGHVNAKPEVVV
jgi:catalase